MSKQSSSSRFVSAAKALRTKSGSSSWDTAAERMGGRPRWDKPAMSPLRSRNAAAVRLRP